MSMLYILGSWTVFLLTALWYLGLLGGTTIVKVEKISKGVDSEVDLDETPKAKKKAAKKKKRKKKKRKEKSISAAGPDKVCSNQEEKPDSVSGFNKEKLEIDHNVPEKGITNIELPSEIAKECLNTDKGVGNISADRSIPTKVNPGHEVIASVDPSPFLSTESFKKHDVVTTDVEAVDFPTPTPTADDSLYIPASSPPVSEPDDGVLQEIESEDTEAPIEVLGGDWFAYKSTEHGLPYYYNVRTQETVWDRPVVQDVHVESEKQYKPQPQAEQQDISPQQEGNNMNHQISSGIQQHSYNYGQSSAYRPQQLSRPITFAEKLRLAKQQPKAAAPRLLVRTPLKKAEAVPPPDDIPVQMPKSSSPSSWASLSAAPAKKVAGTAGSWVKVRNVQPSEPEKKKGPPTLAEQLITFRNALQQARCAKKWKQQELAKKLDLRPVEYAKYEAGKEVPSPNLINKMTRLLGVKLPRVKKIKMKETQPLLDD